MSILQHKCRDYVRFEDCGKNGYLSALAAMRRFQQAANEHTKIMHVTAPELEKACGGRWILSKMRLEFKRHLKMGDEFEVATWPLAPGTVRLDRCFTMEDSDGVCVAACTSQWCILNLQTGALVKVKDSPYPFEYEHLSEKPDVKKYSAGRSMPEETDLCYERLIRPSDLDYNGHTNNLHYINMATDCFPTSILPENAVKALEIHYLGQSFEGDNIKIYRRETQPGVFLINGICGEREIFKSLIEL